VVFEVKTALGALVLPNRHVLGTRSMWHLGGDHVRREHDPHVTIGSRRGTDSLPCRGRKWCAEVALVKGKRRDILAPIFSVPPVTIEFWHQNDTDCFYQCILSFYVSGCG